MTKARRRAILSRYNGLCGMCLKPLGDKWVADHMIPLELAGPDDLNNLWPLCGSCNRLKTSRDLKAIAKVRRLLKKAEKKPPDPVRNAKRQIRSRGFDKTVKRRLDGKVVRPADR